MNPSEPNPTAPAARPGNTQPSSAPAAPSYGATQPEAALPPYMQPLPPLPPLPGTPPAAEPPVTGIPGQTYGPQPAGYPVVGGVAQPAQVVPTVAHPKVNPNSTQNTLQIAEIRDGIVIMNDGTFRSVVMVKSINFDLMSPQEREAVEYSFQGFLNSLYFPIQIFIRSQKVDLQPYIEKLDKIRREHDNMLLALLMEDYIAYIDNLSLQTNIMDKKFYVVIPYFPEFDTQKALAASKSLFTGLFGMFKNKQHHVVVNEVDLEKGKTELRNRVQAVLGGLMQCNIQGLPLDTQELIELYYDTYNPDTATRQQLKNFEDLSAAVVTKGEGMAPQPNLERELQ